MKPDSNDTIAAISTPPGEGGIGIVRMSGPKAVQIAAKIFKQKNKSKITRAGSFTVRYGIVHNKLAHVDEVLLTVMLAPKTYTKEDVVEISCHGGIVPLRTTLRLCLENGARAANPGEFTKRAFLNGRIDLAQAEAVINIIRSKTDAALKCAVGQLEGRLSKMVNKLREKLIDILAGIEASLDYPEDGIPFISRSKLSVKLNEVSRDIEKLLKTSETGRIIREGLVTVLVGKPNAGKSSILNALLQEEKAIVTAIPGTTRDIVEDTINIHGIPVIIKDTAGIRHTKNEIEIIGVRKSRESIRQADLVLFVLDLSTQISKEDRIIAADIKDSKVIILGNKCDLKQKPALARIKKLVPQTPPPAFIKISAKEGKGIASLEKLIYRKFIKGELNISDTVMVTDIRHKNALLKAYTAMKKALRAIGASEEFIALDLRQALDALGEIVGETTTEDILDRVFSRFCVGK